MLDEYLVVWDFTWGVFKDFLADTFIKIRPEILNLIPMSAYFFTGSFIKLISINNGGIFTAVPNEFRKRIVEISLYVS